MKKNILLAVFLIVFTATYAFTALKYTSSSPSNSSINAEINVSSGNYRYYEKAGKVAYVSSYRGTKSVNGTLVREKKYSNTSLRRWTAMQGQDAAIREISSQIEEKLGTSRPLTFITEDSKKYEFRLLIIYEPSNHKNYSFEEVRREVPSYVNASVYYKNYKNSAIVPVDLERRNIRAIEQELNEATPKNIIHKILTK